MSVERVPVTVRGYESWMKQLKQLKEVDRFENVRDIERAREHGDIKENAEYHAAKEKQGMIMAYIRSFEDKISRAQVVDPATLSSEKVMFGATVTLLDFNNDEEVVYQLVGEAEADLKAGRISITSPLARGLVGREVDDAVEVTTPGGRREYEVLAIVYQ
jgi:transcription elongation factor GreA